jgi:hypothetical protein
MIFHFPFTMQSINRDPRRRDPATIQQ